MTMTPYAIELLNYFSGAHFLIEPIQFIQSCSDTAALKIGCKLFGDNNTRIKQIKNNEGNEMPTCWYLFVLHFA